jgi:pyroglutamyl-peptidase
VSGILVTGFGPFGEHTENPSGLLASALDGREVAGEPVAGAVLPVSTAEAPAMLDQAIAAAAPDVLLVLGLAAGRNAAAVERAAINVRDFPIPDADGLQVIDEPVLDDGPAAYLTGLPVKAILAAWQDEGLPGYVSNTAGTYLCNQVFYLAAHRGAAAGFRAGLLHLPALPGGAARSLRPSAVPQPSATLATMEAMVRRALAVTIKHRGADLAIAGGAVS